MHHLTCGHCGTSFDHARKTALYCGTPCKERAKYLRQVASGMVAAKTERQYARLRSTDRVKRYPEGAVCTAEGCERKPTSTWMCATHYRKQARADGRVNLPSDRWNDNRRNHRAKRAALMRGATSAERVDKRKVYERDNWTCGICLKPVDQTLAHPHPMSVSLDHVTALANGGTHTYQNTQCSHLRCNLIKSDRVAYIAS